MRPNQEYAEQADCGQFEEQQRKRPVAALDQRNHAVLMHFLHRNEIFRQRQIVFNFARVEILHTQNRRSLLRRAFVHYRDLGRTAIALGVDATNTTGAVALYEKVGMRPALVFEVYEHDLA